MIDAQRWLGLVALTGGAMAALRWAPAAWGARAEAILRHRAAPWCVGLLTALFCFWVAGATLDVEPLSTDEASYILQAGIFGSGHVTAPAAPIQEFFEQPWVMVSPRTFSKYPPGHALALAAGVRLGAPWLVPLLLNFVAGALLFALVRRAVGGGAALLAWCAWILSGMAMAWQTTYFSEVTLLPCWLGALACTWRWTDGGGRRWLVGAGLLTGYGIITRPLSILLLLLPLVPLVLRTARSGRRWADVAWAAAMAGALALFLPAWNMATTGSATISPLREYTETYVPWDRLGFAIDSTPPLRAPPPDLAPIAHHLVDVHRDHTLAALPRTLVDRAGHLARLLFTGWREWLFLLALVGVWRLGRPGWILVGAGVCEFLGHAVWAHEAGWTLYYAESAFVWFIPGAAGAAVIVGWLTRRLPRAGMAGPPMALAALLSAPVLLWLSVAGSDVYRDWRALRVAELRSFDDLVASGPPKAIYFVRYGPPRSGRPALVRNVPPLDRARAWIVYDLGDRDAELLRAAPDRQGFLVDVDARSVTALPAPQLPGARSGGAPTP